MRIRCPSCSATYEVADSLLDHPRTVRCARCARDWTATEFIEPEIVETPPLAEVAIQEIAPQNADADVSFHEPAEPMPEPTLIAAEPTRPDAVEKTGDVPVLSAIERLAVASSDPPAPARHGGLLVTAWAASFVILAGLGAGAFVKRNELMRFWPASIRVYAMIGLAPGDMIRNGKPEAAGDTSGKTAN